MERKRTDGRTDTTDRITSLTHTRLTAVCPGLPGWAGTKKVKPIWTLLKQETVSGSGISWAICKSAPRSRQITTPVPHHSVFYRPDALLAAQPAVSKHWRHMCVEDSNEMFKCVCVLKTAITKSATFFCWDESLSLSSWYTTELMLNIKWH